MKLCYHPYIERRRGELRGVFGSVAAVELVNLTSSIHDDAATTSVGGMAGGADSDFVVFASGAGVVGSATGTFDLAVVIFGMDTGFHALFLIMFSKKPSLRAET